MLKTQQEITLSNYNELYDILIEEDHELRKINDLVDFGFVIDAIKHNYDESLGRISEDPIVLFKYLLLKNMYKLSDRDLIKRTKTDMAFKYFLGYAPEAVNMIHPTTLTKFRRLRLKDVNLLNLLISETAKIATSNGLSFGNTLILDATHTQSKYNHTSVEQLLLERAKKLRKEVYSIDENMKEKFPKKLVNPSLEEVITYCETIIDSVAQEERLHFQQSIIQKLNYLQEAIDDTEEALKETTDPDAKVGHKSKEDSFFGYKTHLGVTENRFIASATQTSGEKGDGKELESLVKQAESNGMKVEEILADTAYSGKDNLLFCKDEQIKLISKLHPILLEHSSKKESKYTFNKDAGMFVCEAGHLAIRKARQGKKCSEKNQMMVYYFDIEKCKICSKKSGCYKDGAKSKSYSLTIKKPKQEEQRAFQETDYFKKRYRQRYIVEAKNSELKNRYGYDRALLSGLFGMQLQGAVTIFNANVKRIMTMIRQ